MKVLVSYTIYDNCEWRHTDKTEVVEANSEEEAKQIIKNRSNFASEYIVNYAKEILEG